MKNSTRNLFDYRQIPNALTLLRVVLVPVIIAVYFAVPEPFNHYISAGIFILAAITDWLDGFLARLFKSSSLFGEFLDPVADKIMVATVVVCLCSQFPEWWFIVPAVLVIGREITISALREWMAKLGNSSSVAVAYIGKVKTAVQMISLIFLLYYHSIGWFPTKVVGMILFYGATVLTLWSMVSYFAQAFRLWWPQTEPLPESKKKAK